MPFCEVKLNVFIWILKIKVNFNLPHKFLLNSHKKVCRSGNQVGWTVGIAALEALITQICEEQNFPFSEQSLGCFDDNDPRFFQIEVSGLTKAQLNSIASRIEGQFIFPNIIRIPRDVLFIDFYGPRGQVTGGRKRK